MSEDFSATTRILRKQLWESAAKERSEGKKVKLAYDKINIDGTLFRWDSSENKRVPILTDKKTSASDVQSTSRLRRNR